LEALNPSPRFPAAFRGVQAAGAVMIAGGAAIWGASKLTKLIADNWSGIQEIL